MANNAKKNNDKGSLLEEIMAEYFRKIGYFVVRGVPFSFDNESVTDIDLWMYLPSSVSSREVAIVDIKNKKTPQAIERIFWTLGLQKVLEADKVYVVTTDVREKVVSFGKSNDVTVINGVMVGKIKTTIDTISRISEDDLNNLIKENTFGKIDGDWKYRLSKSKEVFADRITFDSLNYWISEAEFFVNTIIARPQVRTIALRCFYKIMSYICVGIDYLSKEIVFSDKAAKLRFFNQGLMLGNRSFEEVKNQITFTIELVKKFDKYSRVNESSVFSGIDTAFNNLNTRILSEYISNNLKRHEFFELAKEFDLLANGTDEPSTSGGKFAVKSFIACLLDYWNISRVDFVLTNQVEENNNLETINQNVES